MAQIILEIPDDVCNQLNNYYFDNFNYEIHTQLQNFIYQEWMKCECEDCSSSKIENQPIPSIINLKDSVAIRITCPDGTNHIKQCKDYKECINTMNDLSKTGYSVYPIDLGKTSGQINEDSSTSIPPTDHMEYIRLGVGKYKKGRYLIIHKHIQFGTFKRKEDAIVVRDFLQEHDWDKKYQSKNLSSNKLTASNVLLQIARGEIEYENRWEDM